MRYIPLYEMGKGVSEKVIRDNFVANKPVLDLLVKNVSSEGTDSIPQPCIIIGGGGTGKTWLLKALEFRILKEMPGFHVLVPNQTALSSASVLLSMFKDAATSQEKRLVVLIDDIEKMLDRMSDNEQYSLRGLLNKNGAPILIGSSSVVPKALTDYRAAFFDGFAITNIGNLTIEQALEILGIDNNKGKERALNLLAVLGTSIRNVQLVRNVMTMSRSKVEDEQILFDFLYATMDMKLCSLPDISKRIVTAIALSENGLRLTELSERLQVESNKLSSYTFKLSNLHVLDKEVKNVRNAKYTIADKDLLFFIRKKEGYSEK